jgi:hypothetical protein
MFEKIKLSLRKLAELNRKEPFDASRFNDPVALATEWLPAKSGGANFRTHKLKMIDFNRYEFRSSGLALFFYFIFFAVGISVFIVFAVNYSKSDIPLLESDLWMPGLFGLIFTAAGTGMFAYGAKPIVFDRRAGYFWKCWKAPDRAFNPDSLEEYTRLNDIHALQLLSEYVRSDKSSYHSYELNLILKDGTRINVVDHGDLNRIRDDARTLSDFLGKPVWDAI